MTRAQAIKQYFNPPKVKNSELLQLRRDDKKGYDWVGDQCLIQLGETLTEDKTT